MRRTFFADNTLSAAVGLMGETREFLRGAGLTSRSLYIAELSLEEMLTNTIKYAYDDQGVHRIEVIAEVQGGRVILELRDDGHEFDPTRIAVMHPVVPLGNRAKGGYGIELVRKLVDDFNYRREGQRNVISLGFSAAAPDRTTG